MKDQKLQGFFFGDFKNSYLPEILKEMYRDRVYDPYLYDKKDLTILDIGGNIGIFSYYAYPFAKRIICVEPSEEHCETIRHMLKFNGMDDKVEVVQAAVGGKTEKATLFHNENVTMYSLSEAVNGKPDEAEKVQVYTMKDLLEVAKVDHVDFMKIDVEGAEGKVFATDDFAEVADKIDTIVGEWHTWSGVSQGQLIAMLTDRGYRANWLHKTEASLFDAVRL